jgi:DNA-binding NtrC family response regulator
VLREINVLAVDDEEGFLSTMAKLLAKRGCRVETASGGGKALDILADHEVDVVILDVKMPGMDGIKTLKEGKRLRPATEFIMLTGHGTLDTAMEAIQLGAFDYLIKPCSLDKLLQFIKDAADRKWVIDKHPSPE